MQSKAIATRVKKLAKLKEELDKKKLEYDKAKKKYDDLDNELMNNFSKDELSSFKVEGVGTYSLVPKEFYQIIDNEKFRAYVVKNKALDLFQNRLSSTAIKERLENGKKIPGIQKGTSYSSRFTRAKK